MACTTAQAGMAGDLESCGESGVILKSSMAGRDAHAINKDVFFDLKICEMISFWWGTGFLFAFQRLGGVIDTNLS